MSTVDEVRALLEKATPDWHQPWSDEPPSEADAALIAAAPDIARAYLELAAAAEAAASEQRTGQLPLSLEASLDALSRVLSKPLRSSE